MRLALVVAIAAGCSFHTNGNSGDVGSGSAMMVDDTAADFMADQTLDNASIDPLGSIEPSAFVLGGFHARACLGDVIATSTSWADVETAATTAGLVGEAYEQLPIDWGGSHPRNLSLNTDDNFTVLYDGELLIPAGDHMVSVDVDDYAVLQLDQQVALAHLNTQTLMIHEDTPTWVPLRAAIGEDGGNSRLVISIDGTPITGDQTRARVTQAQGLLAFVYYAPSSNTQAVVGPAVAAPNVNWGMAAPPYDLNGPSTSYTARFMGQLRIPADGSYTLATATTSTDDTSELYIDRQLVTRTSAYPEAHPATATIPLTAGWHSIVVELAGTQRTPAGNSDPHAATLAATINGAPITADMLRPAVDSGYLAQGVGGYTALNDTTSNGGVTTIGIAAPQPPPPTGATIDSATSGYVYYHAAYTDYTKVIADYAGTSVPMASTGAVVYAAGDQKPAGMPVPTTANAWSFTFTDTVAGDSTGFGDPQALVFTGITFHGGPQKPFAPRMMYVSGARALTGITAFGTLHVTADLAGATATISVRTADTAQDLETAGWIDVPNDSVPTAAPLPYLQYRIVITGDGWQYPVVDKVELGYVR
jgi:hypothetical protein